MDDQQQAEGDSQQGDMEASGSRRDFLRKTAVHPVRANGIPNPTPNGRSQSLHNLIALLQVPVN